MKEKIVCFRSGKTVRQLAYGLKEYWSGEEDLACEILRTPDGTYAVQGEERKSRWDAGFPMDRSAYVLFTAAGEDRVRAVIRPGKRRGRYGTLAAGLLLQWGLAVCSLYGILRQERLVLRTRRFIRRELAEPTARLT